VSRRYKFVGLGESLWDMLPEGKQLGGAPVFSADHPVPPSHLSCAHRFETAAG
jgi:hypothetical protein